MLGESWREQRGVCVDLSARWVFVLCPRVGHMEGQLCTASDAHSHTHRADLLQQSPSGQGKRGFDSLPANLVANCQCLERLCFAWAVQAFSIKLSLNLQYLAKNSSKRNREFPALCSYQFCIIWFTIPLKVFILPLIKLKSACSLVQELTSLWCYILCNGVRAGKAFTAKPRRELNLQCLSPWSLSCLLPSSFTCTFKTWAGPWKYPTITATQPWAFIKDLFNVPTFLSMTPLVLQCLGEQKWLFYQIKLDFLPGTVDRILLTDLEKIILSVPFELFF